MLSCCGAHAIEPEPPILRGVEAGVQVRQLKAFSKRVPLGASTLDVVLKIIKPETEERKCRYAVLLAHKEAPGATGRARVFISHTWRAPFRDLVAAIAYLLPDDDYVWIDVCPRRPQHSPPRPFPCTVCLPLTVPTRTRQIFAVLQWELADGISEAQAAEKVEDLDFATVVRATEAFVLVGTHVESVASMSLGVGACVPEEARQLSAFFRVWCLVEMEAALRADLPVVLLVGAARGDKKKLRFEPNVLMLPKLFFVIDVKKASASRKEDQVRALAIFPPAAAAAAAATFPTPFVCLMAHRPGSRSASWSRWTRRWGSTRSTRSPRAPCWAPGVVSFSPRCCRRWWATPRRSPRCGGARRWGMRYAGRRQAGTWRRSSRYWRAA